MRWCRRWSRGHTGPGRWLRGLLCAALLTAPAPLLAQQAVNKAPDTDLVFLFSPPNKPPYWYFEADQPRGILFDLLTQVARKRGIAVKAQVMSRKRGELQVRSHPRQLVARALEWVPESQLYLYSDPVMAVPDLFVSLRSAPMRRDQVLESDEPLMVSSHIGYIYPTLQPYFSAGLLIRSDTTSELAMLEQVLKGRTPVAFMARPVARWYIRSNRWQQQLYLSEPIDGGYSLRFIFNPEQAEFVRYLNLELAQMRRDGRWQTILDRYQ